MDDSVIGHDAVAEWDPLKLSVDVSALGITGYQAKDWLEDEHKFVVQLGDARHLARGSLQRSGGWLPAGRAGRGHDHPGRRRS
jgi:hypothetical protein